MHDYGALVWVVVVVAGVISSMVKSVKKASAQRAIDNPPQRAASMAQPQRQAAPEPTPQMSQRYLAQRALLQSGQSQPQYMAQPQQAAPLRPQYSPGGSLQTQWASALGPTVASAPPPLSTLKADPPTIVQRKPVPKAVPKPAQALKPTIEPWHQEPGRATGYRGFLFEEKSSIVRGIIAAEVLGAPLALREGTFWSQQHSGRSI